MHLLNGAALLAAATIFDGALASLVTVTEYASICPNTNHHKTRSTKVVHSTVTVSPQPFTDYDANHGTPFFLEVQAFTANTRQRRSASPEYVMVDGATTQKTEHAAQFVIHDGMLTTIRGGYVSAGQGTRYIPLAITSKLRTQNSEWKVHDGIITWSNDNFANDMAKFFETTPAGPKHRQVVIIRFYGPVLSDWTPVVLAAVPAHNASHFSATHSSKNHPHPTASNSMSAVASSSASSKSHKKHHPDSSALLFPSHTVSMSMHTGHHHHSSATGKYSNNTATASRSGSGSTSSPVPPIGHCGSLYGGTCSARGAGLCCSQYGYCGTGPSFCGYGCQVGYGLCWRNSTTGTSSSMASMSTTSMSVSSPSSTNITTPSSTFTSTGGPIGPDHPLSINTTGVTSSSVGLVSVTSSPTGTSESTSGSTYGTGSGTVTSISSGTTTSANGTETSISSMTTSTQSTSFLESSSTSGSSATSAMSSATPCPSNSATLCGASTNHTSTTCASSGGTTYNTTCGVEYQGTSINTTNVVGLPATKVKRASETSLADCQSLCDYYRACIAINFIGTNCTLLSHITGETQSPGAVGAAVPPQDVAAKTNPPSSTTVASTSMTSSSGSSMTVSSSGGASSVMQQTSASGSSASLSSSEMSTPISTSGASKSIASESNTQTTSSTVTTSSGSGSSSQTGSSANSTNTASTTRSSATASSATSSGSSTTTSSATSTGYLVLTSPTPCSFGQSPTANEDDSFCEVQLPFAMQMYSQSSNASFASTNGLLSIQNGTSQYSIQHFPASNIPNNTVAPFWDDLYLRGVSTPQDGIFYQFNTAKTAITYEYYLHRGNPSGGQPTSNATYHFTVAYDSTQPGIFTLTYYATGGSSDEGATAAVGMQGVSASGEIGTTYSFQSASITPGLVLKCTTAANLCEKVTSEG